MYTLHFSEWHESGATKTALLIHGIGNDSTAWHHIGGQLAADGYRVIAPDLPGHGQSPRLEQYSVETWVEAVLQLLAEDAVKPQLIIGHSLGGLIAAGIAPSFPEAKLILIDPAWQLPGVPIAWIVQQSLAGMRRYTSKSLHVTRPGWSDEDIDLELEALRNWDAKSVRGLTADASKRILEAYLALPNNTTVVKPARSFLVPRSLSRKLRMEHGVNVINIPKVTHNLHRDDPELFMRAIHKSLN